MVRTKGHKYYWVVDNGSDGYMHPEVATYEDQGIYDIDPTPRERLGQSEMACFLLWELPVSIKDWKENDDELVNKIVKIVSCKSLKELW